MKHQANINELKRTLQESTSIKINHSDRERKLTTSPSKAKDKEPEGLEKLVEVGLVSKHLIEAVDTLEMPTWFWLLVVRLFVTVLVLVILLVAAVG